MSPVDSADILQVPNFVEIALSHTVSEINALLHFYAEIQDGREKWRESDFCEKSPVHSGHPVGQKFSHFIALIHPIQWTIALPVGADRPAKQQKKSPYMSA